jgi:hypothetical protein
MFIVYKKIFFPNIKRFLAFFTLSFFPYSLSLLRDDNFFFFIYSEWGIKKFAFYTDFKNENLFLVKSAPKISFSQKNWVHFSLRSTVHF